MSIAILPDDQADFPGLVPTTIVVWVRHPVLGEIIRELSESLAISLNVYCDPSALPDLDDLIDAQDAMSALYPVQEVRS